MPAIYISPSSRETVPSLTGSGSEAYQMHLLADALEPYLLSCGIEYERALPEMDSAACFRQANEGAYDLFLALRPVPAGGGRERGVTVLSGAAGSRGQTAAQYLAAALRAVYPLPDQVAAVTAAGAAELLRPKAPAVVLMPGCADSLSDAVWLESHRDLCAEAIAAALAAFFDLPFVYPQKVCRGTVSTPGGAPLPLRIRPCAAAETVAAMPAGSTVSVCGRCGAWYVVRFGDRTGYAAAAYIVM